MVIRTIFTCVIRFFCSIRAAFVSMSPSRTDVESRVHKSFGAVDVEMGRTSAVVEPDESSYYVSGRKPSRKISTVRPVKSRIVDAVLRNVRDKRSGVLRDVVITHNASSLHLPCTAKVEVFPEQTPSSRASISSALRVFKMSGKRVVKFVLTPTLLPDADPLPLASRPARSDHSIEDIINLFPSPPAHVSLDSVHSPKELDCELNPVAQNSPKRTEEYRSSLSTSGSFLSTSSGDTAATSPPTTPELAQMTQMIVASIGTTVEPLSVEPSHLSPWNDRYRELDSAIMFPLSQEDDMFSGNAHEDLTFVTQDSDMTSKRQQGRNPESTSTAADSEPMQKDTSMKHIPHAFPDANGEDRLMDILYQGLSTRRAQVTPPSAEDMPASSSDGLAKSNSMYFPST